MEADPHPHLMVFVVGLAVVSLELEAAAAADTAAKRVGLDKPEAALRSYLSLVCQQKLDRQNK